MFAAPTSTTVQNLFITAIPSLPCVGTNGSGLVISGTCGSSIATTTITAQGTTINGPSFTFATSGPLMAIACSGVTCTFTTLTTSTILSGYSTTTGGNPSASVGLNAVNGTAGTFLRSDGAPALSQTIVPTWTGLHTFNSSTTHNGAIVYTSSTASRLLQTNAQSTIISVADLTAWVAGTTSEITVTSDGDGSLTLSLPTLVDLGVASNFTTVGLNTTNATNTGHFALGNASGTNGEFSGTFLVGASSTFGGRVTISSSTASTCARYDASKNLVSATGDCAAGANLNFATGTPNGVTFFYAVNNGTSSNTFTYATSSDQLTVGNVSSSAARITSSTIGTSFVTSATTTNESVTTKLQIPTNQTLTVSGQISVKTTSSTLNFYNGSAERVLNPERCFSPVWTIENPTATEDIPVLFFTASSTITKVQGVNKTNSDTVTFNLAYSNSRASSTASSQKVFTSDQAVNATTTLSNLTINGSSTTKTGDVMRFFTSAASSTQFSINVCWREIP